MENTSTAIMVGEKYFHGWMAGWLEKAPTVLQLGIKVYNLQDKTEIVKEK